VAYALDGNSLGVDCEAVSEVAGRLEERYILAQRLVSSNKLTR